MLRTTIRPIKSLPLMLAAIFLAAAGSNAIAQTCETATDAQIVADVYAKLRGDSKIAAQISHINVVSVNAAVKLQGWVNNQKDFDRVVELVGMVRCVRVINVNWFEPNPPENLNRSGSCSSGMKACGDICIPAGDVCSVGGASGD